MDLEMLSAEPEGPAREHSLLFVHGAWHAAWCWAEHFLPFFATHGYRSRALSLRAHGASPGKLRFASIADYVADLSAAVDDLDDDPVLVGHSMGGLVVQKYLERRRAPAAALMASCPVRGAWRATFRVARRHPAAFAKANLTLSLWPVVATPGLACDALFSASYPDEALARHHARLQDESYRAYVDMLLRLPKPRRIDTRVFVLGAADDAVFSPDEVRATARAYGTEATIVDDLAHDVMLDTHWEKAAQALLEGLDSILTA